MADRPCNGFISPELHWPNHSLGSSHILGKTKVQNLFAVLYDQSIGTSVLLARGNDPSQQFSSSLPSTAKAPSSKHPPKNPPNPLKLHILEGVLHLATVPVLAPMERIYLLMQCQNELIKSGRLSSPYIGMKDCFFRTIKNEGVISLWRGSNVYVARILASEALSFSYEKYFYRIMGYDKNFTFDSVELDYMRLFGAVIPTYLFMYPLDYARTRLATDVNNTRAVRFSLDSTGKALGNQAGRRQFTGLFDVWLKTLKSDGILGLYRGFTLRCLGNISYALTASEIKYFHRIERQKQERRTTLLATMFPSFILWGLQVAHYPVYSVSRRMMMTSGEAEKYKGTTDAFRQIIKHEGLSSLYKGVTAYIIITSAKNATFALVVVALYALLKSK